MPWPGEVTTHPPESDEPLVLGAAPGEVPVLVLVHSDHEPSRVGEAAILGDTPQWMLGRNGPEAGAPARVLFARHRPGEVSEPRPLTDPNLSRDHIAFDLTPIGHNVTKVGRDPMLVNGEALDKWLVTRDDVIEIKGSGYLLLYTTWPRTLVTSASAPTWPFGVADPHGIAGESPEAWALRSLILVAARSVRHVLLHGASGTGKELVARAIHALSARALRAFVARNAATLPAGLVDSEINGTAKGYPNAGMPERLGIIGAAEGGTWFLDEIGEMSIELQAHLLRLLDPHQDFQRLGDPTVRRADVRVIAATNRELSALKEDVLARFSLRIELPSLDARREDIPFLVRHCILAIAASEPEIAESFVRRGAGEGGRDEVRVHPVLMTALLRRKYATNVRELDRLLWECMWTTPGTTVMPTKELRESMPRRGSMPPLASTRPRAIANGEKVTRELAEATLAAHGGNQTKAAEALGISRDALRRVLGLKTG